MSFQDGSLQNLVQWIRPGTPDRRDCATLISTQGTNSLPVQIGNVFCVQTVRGRIAVLVVKSYDQTNFSVIVHVTVWSAVEPSPSS
jgi:hypothetical protein